MSEMLLTTVPGGEVAYPVVDGIPVVIAPEALTTTDLRRSVTAERYAEAYQERELYSRVAYSSLRALEDYSEYVFLSTIASLGRRDAEVFPDPPSLWMDRGSTVAAKYRSFSHLAPLQGSTVLQIGGSGSHALLFLLAGADRAIVVSPVFQELRLGMAMARELELTGRFAVVGGLAEELPLRSRSVDRVYSGSSIHHTRTDESFPEIARVLGSNGRFASVDVWQAPLHHLGTTLFGKSGGNEYCRPMNSDRLDPVESAFLSVECSFHGSFFRYPLAVAARVGWRPSRRWAWRLARWEDSIAVRSRLIRRGASIVSVRCSQPRLPPSSTTNRPETGGA